MGLHKKPQHEPADLRAATSSLKLDAQLCHPTESVVYLVNFTKAGRHVALLSTHDEEFVKDLRAMQNGKYKLEISASSSPLFR